MPMMAHAESDSMTHVERTAAFDVALTIGPPQAMQPMSMHASDTADMDMGHDSSTQPQQADQGMAVNHWLDVHITQADSGAVVTDVTPTIRIVDKGTGVAHDLPNVMGMSGGMNASDVHYGQNVFLPDGTYLISVLLGPSDTAQFRDVMVVSSAMMSDTPMGPGHHMSMPDQAGTQP
jgi:hypothetical protein